MKNFMKKPLLVIGLVLSGTTAIVAETILNKASAFSDAAYACKNSTDGSATTALCARISAYNDESSALGLTVSKLIIGAGSLCISADGAHAIERVDEKDKPSGFNGAISKQIAAIKSSVEGNARLRMYASDVENNLQSEACASHKISIRLTLTEQLKDNVSRAWNSITDTARAAYGRLKESLAQQVEAVVGLISGSRITTDDTEETL